MFFFIQWKSFHIPIESLDKFSTLAIYLIALFNSIQYSWWAWLICESNFNLNYIQAILIGKWARYLNWIMYKFKKFKFYIKIWWSTTIRVANILLVMSKKKMKRTYYPSKHLPIKNREMLLEEARLKLLKLQ